MQRAVLRATADVALSAGAADQWEGKRVSGWSEEGEAKGRSREGEMYDEVKKESHLCLCTFQSPMT